MLDIPLILVLVVATAIAWRYIISRLGAGLPVLAYRRRRPDPWGLLDVALFLAVVALSCRLALAFVNSGFSSDDELTPTTMFAIAIGELVGCVVGIPLIFARHGIPLDRLRWHRRRMPRDLAIGLGGFATVVVPMYALQTLLRTTFQSDSHPLVDMVTHSGSQGFLAASVAAMVAAPITEEILFRMLLQGSLESIAMRRTSRSSVHLDGLDEGHPPASRARRRVPVWPMMVSAGLFAIAHGGHGTDPIPLFPLAMALGYLYRQTHRIAPCIIMHASFNAFSMLLLWLMLWGE